MVGETIINCFDGKYDKYTLKKWSEENKLLCPDCLKSYEYCHGEVINPYFRHKEKSRECDTIYHEPETDEHIKGKILLYNWLIEVKDELGLENIKLESYIPSTRQRPDIYFEMNNKMFVIEFQCTPIASEYLYRKDLYKLANINDIWILGTLKYDVYERSNGNVYHKPRFKFIEQHEKLYLDTEKRKIFIGRDFIKQHLPYKLMVMKNFYSYFLNDCTIGHRNNSIFIRDDLFDIFVKKDENLFYGSQKCI